MEGFNKYWIAILIVTTLSINNTIGQLPYEVERTSFSSSVFNDFGPVLFQDTILFYSNRGHESLIRYQGSNKNPLYNLFFVEKDSAGNTGKPEIFSLQLLTMDQNSPIAINPDGKVIVFPMTMKEEMKSKEILNDNENTGLYFSEKKDEIWKQSSIFPYNSPEYSITTPCFSPDGKILYFASDKPGGYGGMDLYISEWKDSKWIEPVNLGDRINTNLDEVYPFISEPGFLFFASDGHSGLGKKDIFLSNMKDGEWIFPVHLSAPINSIEEDFAFSTGADFLEGYFFSNRGNSSNIYRFSTLIPQLFDCDTMLDNNYCFEFWDDLVEGIDTLPVTYEWEFSDGQRKRGLVVEHCLPGPGSYSAKLNIVDNITSNTFFTQSTMEFTLSDFEQAFIQSNSAGLARDSMYFDASKSNLPNSNNASYFWDMGDGTYGSGLEMVHVFQSSGVYDIKLGVEESSPEFQKNQISCVVKRIQIVNNNQELAALLTGMDARPPEIDGSETEINDIQQDFSVFDVDPEEEVFRVEVFKAEEKVLLNDTVFDPLRVDYEIKEFFLPEDSLFSYTVGEFGNLLSSYDIYSDVVEKGFNSASVQTYVLAELPTAIIEKINRAFAELADANFEFDNAEVSEASYEVLNMVVDIMKENPDLAMEIGAHTDNIGSFDYNLNLSQRRAESIINYLVSQGVDRIRLLGTGYGESRPIESNATEQGRQVNRRVEFIILNER